MKIQSYDQKRPAAFGMKFQFKRLSPKGDWYGADREFFNSTYQLGIISSRVQKLKPENTEFILNLDLPKHEVFPTYDEKKGTSFFNTSYNMFVELVKDNKKKKYDLSEKDVILDAFNASDRLEVHPKGPFSKLLDFIDGLNEKKYKVD